MFRDEDMSERAERDPSCSVHGDGDDQPSDRHIRAIQRVFHQSRRIRLFASPTLLGPVSRRRNRRKQSDRYRFVLNNLGVPSVYKYID